MWNALFPHGPLSYLLGCRMLIYHPIEDVNHCVFRSLLLLDQTKLIDIDLDLYKLLDFYILFPHMLKSIDPLPKELTHYKKLISKIPEPFEAIRNTRRVFYELESLQNVALQNLLAKELIDYDGFMSNRLKRSNNPLPTTLQDAIKSASQTKQEWFDFVVNELPQSDFSGKNGLKKRTGLMEFRYDMEPR